MIEFVDLVTAALTLSRVHGILQDVDLEGCVVDYSSGERHLKCGLDGLCFVLLGLVREKGTHTAEHTNRATEILKIVVNLAVTWPSDNNFPSTRTLHFIGLAQCRVFGNQGLEGGIHLGEQILIVLPFHLQRQSHFHAQIREIILDLLQRRDSYIRWTNGVPHPSNCTPF